MAYPELFKLHICTCMYTLLERADTYRKQSINYFTPCFSDFQQNMCSSKRVRNPIVRRSNIYSQSHTGNGEAIANNHDLLTQILVCLPVKSLLRFKSVSKGWYSLISDPKFSRRLFPDISGLFMQKLGSTFINPEHGFIPLSHKSSSDAPFKFLTFITHPSGLKVVQSCNGLLLCRSIHNRSFKYDHYIYNPTTKQFVTLPLPDNYQNTRIMYRFSLAFDPTKSPHYKAVCVRDSDQWLQDYDSESSYERGLVEIYSSQTRTWRVSGKPFIAHVNTGFEGGVFCNSAIHWLSPWGKTSLYFNVEEEMVRELPMPPVPDDWEDMRRCRYFGESRGHLHLIEIYRPPTTRFKVYEVESDYSGWFVKYHIDLDPVTVAFPEMVRTCDDPMGLHYYVFSVLCIVREANDEDSYMVLEIPDKAVRYNLKDGSFKKICDFALNDDDNDNMGSQRLVSVRYFWAKQFIQTLASV
ncbi:hypothetical protein PTKIN_Ptkin04bG0010000 [Pterospermum kingtungense]